MNRYTSWLWVILILTTTIFGCTAVTPYSAPVYSEPEYRQSKNIILLGDTQRTLWVEFWREQNDSFRELLFPQVLTHQPSTILLLGDLVSWGASSSSWEYFDNISKPARDAGVGFINVMGNHDYYGSNSTVFKHISARFPIMRRALQQNSTWNCTIIDSIAFLILDSNFDELSEDQTKAQKQWLDSTLITLNTNSSVYNVVLCTHHPAYTNSTIAEEVQEVQNFIKSALQLSNKITLIASGHAHTYEHFWVDNKLNVIVSGGGGGSRQELHTPQDSVHRDLYQGGIIRDFNYCTLKRSNDTIYVSMMHLEEKSKTWLLGEKFAATPNYLLK